MWSKKQTIILPKYTNVIVESCLTPEEQRSEVRSQFRSPRFKSIFFKLRFFGITPLLYFKSDVATGVLF